MPSRRAMRGASILVAVVALCAVLGWVVGGIPVAVGSLLGAVSILALQLRHPAWWAQAWFTLVLAGGSASAAALESAVLVGLTVTVAVAALAPLVLRYGAVIGVVPVIVAEVGTGSSAGAPWPVVVGIGVGALIVSVVVGVLRLPRFDTALPVPAVLRGYLVLLAVASGATTTVVMYFDTPHGVWVVVAIATVLVPMPHDSLVRARARVIGTALGAIVGATIASFVAPPIALAVAIVAILLGLGFAAESRRLAFVACTALAVVVLIGAASPETAVTAGATRIGLTFVGATVAAAAGLVLARIEQRATGR